MPEPEPEPEPPLAMYHALAPRYGKLTFRTIPFPIVWRVGPTIRRRPTWMCTDKPGRYYRWDWIGLSGGASNWAQLVLRIARRTAPAYSNPVGDWRE